ncbi:ribosomal protein L1 [Mycobacterium intracellulare 1956]|uniref:Large ribosomal subunit protein uL1 n=1 Tax=Mycobacterium intracellulare 1956 TaxID=1299331 RepID=X8CBN2_MYCIT|nr:ribosomal protein L1 [Mycobacterium intracellulare 1956]
MSKNSKAYRAAAEKVDRNSLYSPLEAAKLAKETSSSKQDATVEVAIRLGVDPRKADQMVRGTVNLPHGTGKTARVAVFAVGDKAEQAQAAGADIVGSDDLIEKIQGGWLEFDAAIATPDQMAKVGRIARVLGPRGLMPNPKTGTVTPDVAKAVADIKGGKINFRIDKQANLHFVIGKASFDEKSLAENYGARARRGAAAQAVRVEGPLPEEDHRVDDDGAGHSGRPVGHPQLLRGLISLLVERRLVARSPK